jgi:hypothetical protein
VEGALLLDSHFKGTSRDGIGDTSLNEEGAQSGTFSWFNQGGCQAADSDHIPATIQLSALPPLFTRNIMNGKKTFLNSMETLHEIILIA